MEVIKERKRIREKIIKEASSWTAKLPFKATAMLIGSYARGDFNLWSDIDILLISEEFKGNPVERLKALDIPPGFQVIPLTLKEFKKLLTKRNQLAIEATKHGVILRNDLKLLLQVP
ncbi:MAG: nucleotidyltransferase domain-containing protein [Candidatus Hecatellales archaeon]|nr:MAG: nucleotidyltransferase domain-containing protein [Candidatus Hecatellales archaeon]